MYDPHLLYLRIFFALLCLCTPADKLIDYLGIYWIDYLLSSLTLPPPSICSRCDSVGIVSHYILQHPPRFNPLIIVVRSRTKHHWRPTWDCLGFLVRGWSGPDTSHLTYNPKLTLLVSRSSVLDKKIENLSHHSEEVNTNPLKLDRLIAGKSENPLKPGV